MTRRPLTLTPQEAREIVRRTAVPALKSALATSTRPRAPSRDLEHRGQAALFAMIRERVGWIENRPVFRRVGGKTVEEANFIVIRSPLCPPKDFVRLAPLLDLYAIPNVGSSSKARDKKLKAEGLMAGMPDLHLPHARGNWHSLYLELKIHPNKPSDLQRFRHARLIAQDNQVVTVTERTPEALADTAWRWLCGYLELPKPTPHDFPFPTNVELRDG